MWDLFISHASEDKEAFVKPLAIALKKAGLKVWYDEFELKVGDSLTGSIDKGLIDSDYGIVVLSEAFFTKKWTDYELRSLLIKEINSKRVILPIIHNISVEKIQEHSLFLSDAKALSSKEPMPQLVDNILEVVRPDILNNHLLRSIGERMRKQSSGSQIEYIPVQKLNASPPRHTALPAYLVISCRLISEILQDVLDLDYRDMVENFARDMDYDSEFVVWSAMANAYIAFIREMHCPFDDISKKREALALLLNCSFDVSNPNPENREYKSLSESEQSFLSRCFFVNLKMILDMVQEKT